MSDADQQISRLMDSLYSEGDILAEDEFGIAPDWLSKSLDRLLLPNPYNGLLHLVASAVAAGAESVDIELSSGSVEVSYTGRYPGKTEVGSIFTYLLLNPDNENRYLRELAVGCNNARHLKWEVTVQTPESRLILKKGHQTIETLSLGGSEISIRFRRPRFLNWLSELPKHERHLLSERCRWSPAPVTVNGETLERGVKKEQTVLLAATFGSPNLETSSCELAAHRFEFPSDFRGLVLVGDNRGVRLVARGISYDNDEEAPYPKTLVVIDAQDLALDVVGGQLARNRDYDALLIQANHACDSAVIELIKKQGIGTTDTQNLLARLLERRENGLTKNDDVPLEIETSQGRVALGKVLNRLSEKGHLLWSPDISGVKHEEPVLHFEQTPTKLLTYQLNLVRFVKLPDSTLGEADCLVSVPLSTGRGELGIVWDHSEVATDGLPPGVICSASLEKPADLTPDLDCLYRALMLTRSAEHIQGELLNYLSFRKVSGHCAKEAARRLSLLKADGQHATLLELRGQPEPIPFEVFSHLPPSAPDLSPSTLLLREPQLAGLKNLLKLQPVTNPFSVRAQQCLQDCAQTGRQVTTSALLRALARNGPCRELLRGFRIPKAEKGDPITGGESLADALKTAIEIAAKECALGHDVMVLTKHLLIGVLLADPGLASKVPLDPDILRGSSDSWFREAYDTLERIPLTARSSRDWAQLNLVHRNYDEALLASEKAIELNPRWPTPYMTKGLTLALSGQLEEAISIIEHALEMDPEFSAARHNLCYLLLEVERWEEAEKLLERCDNSSRHSRCIRARIALHNGKPDEAEQLCREIVAEEGAPIGWIFETLALASEAQGKRREARDAYESFVKKSNLYFPEAQLPERLRRAKEWLSSPAR